MCEYKTYADNVICPYCGFEDKNSWEYSLSGDEESIKTQCPNCGEPIEIFLELTIKYKTYGRKERELW